MDITDFPVTFRPSLEMCRWNTVFIRTLSHENSFGHWGKKRTRSVYKSMICVFISLQASWQSVYLSWTISSRLSAPSAAQPLLLSFQSSFISSLWLQKATGASLCLFSLRTVLSWSWACLCSCLVRTPRWHVSLNDIKQEKINCWIGNCDQEDKITLQKTEKLVAT